MSAVGSTARSSPPSADERLATGGPSRRRGAGGEDRANAPFSGTSNARGSREAVSIRMALRWVRTGNPSPTRDRACHAPPVVPTRRFAFDTKTKTRFTNALLMTDTAGSRRARRPRAVRVSVATEETRARGTETRPPRARRCVFERARLCRRAPARKRRPRASSGRVSARTRPLAKKAAKRRTNPAGSPKNFERIIPRAFDEARASPENFGALRAAYCVSFAHGLYFLISRAETRLLWIFTVKRTDHFRVRPVERGDARV